MVLRSESYLEVTMNAPLPAVLQFDVHSLARAISSCQASDALPCQFTELQWNALGTYLQPFPLNGGQVLMEQGAHDCTVYFIESGTLSAHYEDEKKCTHMTTVGPGTVLGEGSFFSQQPRRATVQAASSCKLWCLTTLRFRDLASRHSPIALQLSLAMGAVMARRLSIRPRRAAVT